MNDMVVPRAGRYQASSCGDMWENGARPSAPSRHPASPLASLGLGGLAPGTTPWRPHANGRADASMARSAVGSLRDRKTGRWPLSLIAGNLARTLGARFYAAPESPLPARAPSLASVAPETSVDCFYEQPKIGWRSRWRLDVIQTAES
jgi:hypothetical protein